MKWLLSKICSFEEVEIFYIFNQVTFAGYPCSHLIKLHEYLGNGFPMFLINSRWIKKELDGDIHNFTELNTEINSFNDDDIEVEID